MAVLGIALIVVGIIPMSAQARYGVSSDAAPGTAGVDAWIVSGRKGPIGAGVHSPDGDGQTLTKRVEARPHGDVHDLGQAHRIGP